MLETRLLKYQQKCKTLEDIMSSVNSELLKLEAEKQHSDMVNEQLKQELMQVTMELCTLQKVAGDSGEIQTLLKNANQELSQQLEILQQELLREQKISRNNRERLEELQNMLGDKTIELNQTEEAFRNSQNKLDITICCNKELKCEIQQLLSQIKEYEVESAKSEERCDFCQKEMECCRENLSNLKDKLLTMKDLLRQKDECINKLEADLRAQCDTVDCLKQQLGGINGHYEDDIADLKHTIQDLNEKLGKTENQYQKLYDDYKASQAQLLELTKQEARYQQSNVGVDKEFVEKMQSLQKKESRLNVSLSQLETECNILRNELMKKDRQMNLSQEEIFNVKNEANKLFKANGKLQKENEILSAQIAQLQNAKTQNVEQFKEKSAQATMQCKCEIKKLQEEKALLETKNKNIKKEMHVLQQQYHELDEKYRQLNDSVIALQMEVIDHKMCRDEICVESRNVISNVRAWLQDQALINEKLTQKLREHMMVIEKLKEYNAYLRSKCCCKKLGQEVPVFQNPVVDRSEPIGDSNAVQQPCGQQPSWSSYIQECGSVSPSSTESGNFDWLIYEEYNHEEFLEEDGSLLSRCLKKVESINEELQRSNRYWQSKMVENEYAVTRDQ